MSWFESEKCRLALQVATVPALKLFGRKRAKAMKARISESTVHIHAVCLGPHIRTFCVQTIIYADVHERSYLLQPCPSSAPYALLLCLGVNVHPSGTGPKNISEICTQSWLRGLVSKVSIKEIRLFSLDPKLD